MVELNSQIDDSIMKMMITMKLPELFHIRTHYMHDQKLEISLEDFNASIMQFKAETAIGNLAYPAAVEAHKISISPVKTETEKPATSRSSSVHKDKERPKCVACGKTGHWMVDCHLTRNSRDNNSSTKRRWNNHRNRDNNRVSEICDYCTKATLKMTASSGRKPSNWLNSARRSSRPHSIEGLVAIPPHQRTFCWPVMTLRPMSMFSTLELRLQSVTPMTNSFLALFNTFLPSYESKSETITQYRLTAKVKCKFTDW
jgi:Tfp pilus assembly major pilin PilA